MPILEIPGRIRGDVCAEPCCCRCTKPCFQITAPYQSHNPVYSSAQDPFIQFHCSRLQNIQFMSYTDAGIVIHMWRIHIHDSAMQAHQQKKVFNAPGQLAYWPTAALRLVHQRIRPQDFWWLACK